MLTTRLLFVALIASASCCAGCDTIQGVSRTLSCETLPSAEAVDQAIRATPGVTEVKRRDIPPSDSWSMYKGAIHDPGFAQFFCRDKASAFAAIEPKETGESGKKLYVYTVWIDHVPTSTELSKARELIDRLCKSFHERLPTVPASSSSDDKFMGIKPH